MPVVKCNEVNIEFPFEPYDCQQVYMSKVLQCLQSSTNGILESPTGTGKTLCLLCSTLAWRNTYISQQELGRCLQGGDGDSKEVHVEGSFRQKLAAELKEGAGGAWGEGQEGMFVDRPRIIYASRTHSQLSQAVDQLKDTAYRPRVAVIGSREQLCIHPEVQKAESNSAKVHMCRAKVDSRMCHFHNNLDQKKADKAFTDSILDIEDLVKLGNTHKVCPYYIARELKTNADIVFMPYNYLLDSKLRRIHGIELQGNVVIFDEAHNVERMCEESASFDLTSFDLASCVEETDHLLKKTVEVEMCNQQFRADSGGESDFDASALATLKKLFLDLENEINSMKPPEAGLTKPGSFIYELFAKVHITFGSKVELLQLLEKIISHLTTSSTIFHNKAAGLQKFCDIINIIFNKDTPSGSVDDASRCYKVHVRASAPQKKGGRTDLWTSNNPAKAKKQGYTLSYWCFSPGFSMKDLVSQGVRSIILTSGTLSPLSSFKSELQIDFPIQLENPHVIGNHQMTVAVMTKGPDGTVLNSSYNTRFNRDYVMSLGNAIVNFSRLVPNGLLVFFPSYPVMNHALEQWQESGIQHRITQYKEVFVEPRGKVNFVQTIAAFYARINDPKLNGACFFAVCRGKVSEGLDFADINGRAVVITGLPYPPRMDPRIVLKMQYLDESKRRNRSSLSGQDWYCQQASRAVNQAIGRVIRHKEDFGAILLCDTRFSNRDARSQLPSWVRPFVNVYDQFGKAVKDLTNFFKETERTMPKPQPKQARPSGPVKVDQAQCRQQPTTSSSLAPPSKAKHVDAHVPSLKRNTDGSHVSEAQLKIMYEDSRPKPARKAVGLLSALSSVENTPEGQDDVFLTQRSSQSTGQQTGALRRLDLHQKKKKIVIRQQNGLDSSVDKTGRLPRPVIAASKPETKDGGHNASLASAQDYIAQVKKTLSHDSYKTFSTIMQRYKQSDEFAGMVAGIADLFTEDESKFSLFRNFYTFARPHHKKQFHTICLSLTGQGCGYRPEHSIRPKKLEKQKPQRPTPSVDSNSMGSIKPCRPEQNLPSTAQGMTTSKTGNPMKMYKCDSIDPTTSINGNFTGHETTKTSSHSELKQQKMAKTCSLAMASVSKVQSVHQNPEIQNSGTSAETLSCSGSKAAPKAQMRSHWDSFNINSAQNASFKKDPKSVQQELLLDDDLHPEAAGRSNSNSGGEVMEPDTVELLGCPGSKPAPKMQMQSRIDGFNVKSTQNASAITSKTDPESVVVPNSNLESEASDRRKTNSGGEVMEPQVPNVKGQSAESCILEPTLKIPLKTMPETTPHRDTWPNHKVFQGEELDDDGVRKETLGYSSSSIKSSAKGPLRVPYSCQEATHCLQEQSGKTERGKSNKVKKTCDIKKIDSQESSNKQQDLTNFQDQAVPTAHPDNNPTAATNILPTQKLDNIDELRPGKAEISLGKGTSDKTQQALLDEDPCYHERKDKVEDSCGEDEDEPMSLELSIDEDSVLDASKELFDESFVPDSSTEQNYIILENEANRVNNTGAVPSTHPKKSNRGSVPSGRDSTSVAEEEETDNICNHQELNPSFAQGSKRLRIQKMINHVKRSINVAGSRGEEMDRVGAKEEHFVKRTEKAAKEKGNEDAVGQSGSDSHSKLHSEVLHKIEKKSQGKCVRSSDQSLEKEHKRSKIDVCSSLSVMKIKKKDGSLGSRGAEPPAGCLEDSNHTTSKDSTKLSVKQSCVVQPKGHRTEKLTGEEETTSKTPACVKKHCSEKTVSVVARKLMSRDKFDILESTSTKDTQLLPLHRNKSKSSDSPRLKFTTSKSELQSPSKSKKSKKNSSDCSPAMPSRKRQSDNSPEVLQKKKHRGEEVESGKPTSKQLEEKDMIQSPSKDRQVSTGDPPSDANSNKSDGPCKKPKKSLKVVLEDQNASISKNESTNCPQQAATPKSKKTKGKERGSAKKNQEHGTDSRDSQRNQKTFKKVLKRTDDTPNKAARNTDCEPRQKEKSCKKGQAGFGGRSWISKQSFLEQSASQSHHQRTESDCALCKNKAWPAYRGPCGHVCCQTCWQEYIREFHECPDCGVRTKEKHIVAV